VFGRTLSGVLVHATFGAGGRVRIEAVNLALGPRRVYIYPRQVCFADDGSAKPDHVLQPFESWHADADARPGEDSGPGSGDLVSVEITCNRERSAVDLDPRTMTPGSPVLLEPRMGSKLLEAPTSGAASADRSASGGE
jgi:hypothetical protein